MNARETGILSLGCSDRASEDHRQEECTQAHVVGPSKGPDAGSLHILGLETNQSGRCWLAAVARSYVESPMARAARQIQRRLATAITDAPYSDSVVTPPLRPKKPKPYWTRNCQSSLCWTTSGQ